MNTLLLPVQHFSKAKPRLAALLSEAERAGLARAMYLDVVIAVVGARTLDRIVVLTGSAEISDLATSAGFEVIREGHVNQVMDHLAQFGTVMTIPADIPTLRSMEIDVSIKECDSALGLIPSHDGTKTNAVIMPSNLRVDVSFGAGSLQRQLAACKTAGIPCKVMHVSGIAFDVDTADDLFAFLQTEPEPSHTWQYIQVHRIPLSLLP